MDRMPCIVTRDTNRHLAAESLGALREQAITDHLNDMVQSALISGDDDAMGDGMLSADLAPQISKLFAAVEPGDKLAALADFRNWFEEQLEGQYRTAAEKAAIAEECGDE